LKPVVNSTELLEVQAAARNVKVTADIEDYIIRLVQATRVHVALQLGASPRAMLALYRASQAHAAINNRGYVIPDDVKYLTPFVLTHRMITKMESHLRGQTAEQVLKEVLASVEVPVEGNVGVEN
jgi:MoxR-like ATPase